MTPQEFAANIAAFNLPTHPSLTCGNQDCERPGVTVIVPGDGDGCCTACPAHLLDMLLPSIVESLRAVSESPKIYSYGPTDRFLTLRVPGQYDTDSILEDL